MKKENKLNCAQAKSISIISFLHKTGTTPTRQNKKEAWYKSPFRNEKDASFKVSKRGNCWYDHGTGEGGNIIDLVIKMNHNCSVKEALSVLSGLTSFSFHQQKKSSKTTEPGITITKIKAIQHPALINYHTSRGIPHSIISKYASEIHYSTKGRHYFALGLKNISGGWELRNAYYKNCSSPKNYTHISDSKQSLIVTEGMFDFFSLLKIAPGLTKENDVVILNTTGFAGSMNQVLSGYRKVKLFLDNDNSGKTASKMLQAHNQNVVDMSHLYADYHDVNDWLLNKKEPQR